MKTTDYIDTIVDRIDREKDDLKEQIERGRRERKDLEKRVRKLERFNSYLKGITAVLFVIGTFIGVIFSKIIRDFLSQFFVN